MKIHKLTLAALLVAIGTLSAHLIYIPAGISKCFPVQHAINVLGAGNFRPRLCDGSGLCHFLPAQYVRYRLTAGFSRQYDRRLSGRTLLQQVRLCQSGYGRRDFRHRYFRRTDCLVHCPLLLEQRGSSLVLYPAVPDQHCRRQYHRRTDH